MRFWQAYAIAAMAAILADHFATGPDGLRGALGSFAWFASFAFVWWLGNRLSPPHSDQGERK